MASKSVGKVAQVLGAVVDVRFDGPLPAILNAIQDVYLSKAITIA